MAGPSIVGNDPAKLVEYLLSDLRNLSTEAKKKHNHVKEAAESGLVKVRNISTGSQPQSLLQNIRSACSEILHPLILGCSSKNPRLVQISLQAIQRMLQFRVVEASSAPVIVNELWHLTEAECEELRVLQTITPFVSTELLVTDSSLAKCIVLAIKLNFSKDPSVINAASASVRQLFSCVFERVIQEDGMKGAELMIPQAVRRSATPNTAPPTLRPCAADGYLLLKDLNSLIRKENPTWLEGVRRITMPLALELLESVLKNYPSVFFKHTEYADLLKNQICPQVVRMFAGEKEIRVPAQNSASSTSLTSQSMYSGSISSLQSASSTSSTARPLFPVMIRSLRIVLILIGHYHQILSYQCEVLMNFLLELLSSEHNPWQAATALEVLHRVVGQPELLRWFCENKDEQADGANCVQLFLSKLTAFIKRMLEEAVADAEMHEPGAQTIGQPGFLYKRVLVPLQENLSAKKWMILDWLDKHEPGPVPEGYSVSVAYSILVDCTHSLYAAIEDEKRNGRSSADQEDKKKQEVSERLFNSSYQHLLEGLSILLDCSIDDSISEAILNCLSTVVFLACRLGNPQSKEATLKRICRAALPFGYFAQCIESLSPTSMNNHGAGSANVGPSARSESDSSQAAPEANQVVAVGTVCPTPSVPASMVNTSVVLTSKNMQVARLLISCAQANGQKLMDCWDMVLATLQHLIWILGMKPTSNGSFRTGGDTTGDQGAASAGAPTVLLTTAVSSELPDFNAMLNKLFESTASYDDVSLHHVIAALCKLSTEAMMVAQGSSREPSFFSIAKLLQTAMSNLQRLTVFWRPVTAHLLEICGHSHTKLREWGAVALTSLVKAAMSLKPVEETSVDRAKRQQLVLAPLAAMSEVDYTAVKIRQMDALMSILQSTGHDVQQELWPLVIRIVAAVVDTKCGNDAQLIEQGYAAVSLMVKEFLGTLPFKCVQLLIETDAKYGTQPHHLNVSLASVGQLWDISDYLRRETTSKRHNADIDTIWLVLYGCLSELCVDNRPPVRKSACDTLLQTVAAHGQALNTAVWSRMVWEILFPMLDKVQERTKSAPTQRVDSASLGASNIMIHHSRDTEAKQWAETTVKTLGGVVKIFNAQRGQLLALDNFPQCWSKTLEYIEYTASTDNSEMSLAALKNFLELLFGRSSTQPQEMKERNYLRDDPSTPQLPEKLWIVAWDFWIRVAKAIVSPKVNPATTPEEETPTNDATLPNKHYIPGQFHLTTLLNIFPPLFQRVRRHIPVDAMRFQNVPSILKEVVSIPISAEQAPFILNAQNSDINPTQECILECVKVVFQEEVEPQSKIRPALPDLLRLLLQFVPFAVQPPTSKFVASLAKETQVQWAQQNMIAFAELSLRTAVEYYAKVANGSECIGETVLIDFIKALAEPLALKYQCPSQTTWKIAASSLINVCRIGLSTARENSHLFTPLWPQLASAIEGFLFSTSKSPTPLNADERKRHEFVDCQMIELIRMEILPYANQLPHDFMQRIIDILNRGSINTMDSNDVLASDSFEQRADLSRVCFDALLSMSRSETPDLVQATSGGVVRNATNGAAGPSASLGATAIASLLHRCKQVLNNYARDEQGCGHFRLPQGRIFEVISVLRAVSALIDGLAKHPEAAHSTLYSHLVNLYPCLVQLIPSCRSDQQVELALMTCLNSYQTLLLVNIHATAGAKEAVQ